MNIYEIHHHGLILNYFLPKENATLVEAPGFHTQNQEQSHRPPGFTEESNNVARACSDFPINNNQIPFPNTLQQVPLYNLRPIDQNLSQPPDFLPPPFGNNFLPYPPPPFPGPHSNPSFPPPPGYGAPGMNMSGRIES